jgi:methionyl-tRNA formyltransferase
MGPTTATALESLTARFDVVALMRAADPGDAALAVAASHGVKVEPDMSMAALRALVDGSQPDCVVVSSYDRILPADLVSGRPFINVHYAPLPRYRGRATVNWAILNGEPEAAISIHELVPGLDAGGILFQGTVPIGTSTNVTDLYAALNALQRDNLAGAVARRLAGDCGQPQDDRDATYACTRVPDDGEIDWAGPTVSIDRLVRALTDPYPGAFTWLGLRRLRIRRAAPVVDSPTYVGRIPGRVVRTSKADGWVEVLTGDGVLRLTEVQWDGEEPVPAATVIRSVKATLGLRVSDLVARIEQLTDRITELENR